MKRLKIVARRSTFLGASLAIFAATAVPTAQTFAAIALNPLTERSLLLSSSAPGFVDTDGSNYSTASPNPAAGVGVPGTYAPAGSGPNGKKTGEIFTFRTSSTANISGLSFQYCTTAAGMCQAPGNNRGDSRDGVATSAYSPADDDETPNDTDGRETNDQAWPNSRSDLNVTGGANVFQQSGALSPGAGEFQISINGVRTTADWAMTTTNTEDTGFTHPDNNRLTGKNNYITLSSVDGQSIPAGANVKVEFKASEDRYITNPGAGSFFVKINTYSDAGATTVVDGGVTVANVMTDSIHITTKVLETMAFSVGVENRDAEEVVSPDRHGTCDAIQVVNNNRLDLGNPAAEFSLETGRAWDVASYWRLSSNSSGGASVYYSGDTLHNTVGDSIRSIGTTQTVSNPGTEQFGLGFYNDATVAAEVSDTFEDEVGATDSVYELPSITPLVRQAAYTGAEGEIGRPGASQGDPYRTATAAFAFDQDSITSPALIAQNNDGVLSCATAKMRYVGNIAADTPAGVYTTKINYLAAPQY